MAKHEPFSFDSLDSLEQKIRALGVSIPLNAYWLPLHSKVPIGRLQAPNTLAVLPMEGCDSQPNGSPSELVERRYARLASGGAGLLWWEACAVVPEGRANSLQMMLTKENAGAFETLLAKTNHASEGVHGSGHRAANVLQLTHSGRYSRPEGHRPAPIIPQHDLLLDPRVGLDESTPIVSDGYLESLVERYAQSARLAREVGFDGVDILSGKGMEPGKCCIACSKCTQIMRNHGRTGCMIRDAKVYAPFFKEARAEA